MRRSASRCLPSAVVTRTRSPRSSYAVSSLARLSWSTCRARAACKVARWIPIAGAPTVSSIRSASVALRTDSGEPSARRRPPNRRCAPTCSTSSEHPSLRNASTAFGCSVRPAPTGSMRVARSITSVFQPDLCSAIAALRPPIPAPTTIAERSFTFGPPQS